MIVTYKGEFFYIDEEGDKYFTGSMYVYRYNVWVTNLCALKGDELINTYRERKWL